MLTLAALFMISIGVVASAAVVDDTVATVNGEAIMLSDFRKEFAAKLRQVAQDDPRSALEPSFQKKLREGVLDEMIDRILLSQAAGRGGVKVLDREVDESVAQIKSRFTTGDDGRALTEEEAQKAFAAELKAEGVDYGRFRERIRRELAGRKLIEREVQPRVLPPADGEARAYFDRLAAYAACASTQAPAGMDEEEGAQFAQIAAQIRHLTAERVRVSDILVAVSPDASEKEIERARAKAQAIRERVLERGTSSFADIARAESEDAQTAPDGGDLGVIARGEAAPGFEKAIFALPLGEVSRPILTGAGWRLALVRDKSIAEPPRFDQFREKLSRIMTQQSFQRQARRYVQDLRRKAEIIVEK